MHDHAITGARQISAEWLTVTLVRGGALRAGRVRDVSADADKSVWSQIVRSRPRYDGDAIGELSILRHHHEQLTRRGIVDYSWQQLVYDYRLAAVQSVYVAVEWCVLEEDRTRMRWLWEQQLRRSWRFSTCADL